MIACDCRTFLSTTRTWRMCPVGTASSNNSSSNSRQPSRSTMWMEVASRMKTETMPPGTRLQCYQAAGRVTMTGFMKSMTMSAGFASVRPGSFLLLKRPSLTSRGCRRRTVSLDALVAWILLICSVLTCAIVFLFL